MKFQVITTENTYYDEKELDKFKELGIKFKKYQDQYHTWFAPVEKGEIEINTAEELMALIYKYGLIVVKPISKVDGGLPEIEIYNDYRE